MASSSPLVSSIILFFFVFISFSSIVDATVSPINTFKYVNEGEFGKYKVEYDGNYRALPLQTTPFALCFYNTTPDAYTLGLHIGASGPKSIMRWVWAANRDNPVKEGATLTFGSNGNLILAEADGEVVWQTGTANKGVTGLKLLSNGNLVLLDGRGTFVWQTFDHPTNALLVGQRHWVSGGWKRIKSHRILEDLGHWVGGGWKLIKNPDETLSYIWEPRRFVRVGTPGKK